MKYKIVHLHKDPKFVNEIHNYNSPNFINLLLYLGNIHEVSDKFDKELINLPHNKEECLSKIVQICNQADLLIINNLNHYAIHLVPLLNPKLKIIWRFFGWELYARKPKLYYSKTTYKYWQLDRKKASPMLRLKQRVWNLLHRESLFDKVLNRIDYFMGIMEEEHENFKKLGFKLAPFVQVPFPAFIDNNKIFEKSNTLILGNSKSRFNNHLDMLKLLGSIQISSDLKIKMLFNYGKENSYTQKVREEIKNHSYIQLQEDFLSYQNFNSLYTDAAALVLNGYRQMAMGNILVAVQNGVKIYLSEKNITYHWILKQNLKVFSIENNLKDDLQKNNIFLTPEEINDNIQGLFKLTQDYSLEKFNTKILEILQTKKD